MVPEKPLEVKDTWKPATKRLGGSRLATERFWRLVAEAL